MSDAPKHGTEEGDICGRDGCDGRIGFNPVKDCSCHISPPCGACTDNPLTCLKCEWQDADEGPL